MRKTLASILNTALKPLAAALACCAALLLGGCDVHEFPSEEPKAPEIIGRFMLHLRYDTNMPLHKEIEYENGTTVDATSKKPSRDPNSFLVRHIINVYPAVRSGEYSRSSQITVERHHPVTETLDADIEFDLPQGDYRILVWTDYIGDGAPGGFFHDASDFNEIIYAGKETYIGDTDFRDAFRGQTDVIVDYGPDYNPNRAEEIVVETTVDMVRPLAKYRFITTDLGKFIDQQVQSKLLEMQKQGLALPEAEESRDPSRYVDLSQYRVRFRYPQYMPCSFNMFTNRPADSWTGMSYDAEIRQMSAKEAEIGFDYVFVNGVESSVAVAVDVLDKDGKLIGSVPTVNVPLKRSKLTEVRGEFLTTKAGGSVGIDPGYAGPDYNIFIP